MTVKHSAFIDLERGLASRLERTFLPQWKRLMAEIENTLDRDPFKAHEIIDTLKVRVNPQYTQGKRFLRTMGEAAFFLGVSRHARANIDVDRLIVGAAAKQLTQQLEHNVTENLRLMAHQILAETLSGQIAKRDSRVEKLRLTIEARSRAYFAHAASLYISRLNSYGYLVLAQARGQNAYEIKAVMDDDRTCLVCRTMDGKVFPVDAGLAHAQHVLSLSDPAALKQAAPFWARNTRAGVAELDTWGIEDLIAEGMHLPPFHPLCRCVVVGTTQTVELAPANTSDRIGLAMETLYGLGWDSDPTVQGGQKVQSKVSGALATALGLASGYALVDQLFGGAPDYSITSWLPDDEEEEEEESFGGISL